MPTPSKWARAATCALALGLLAGCGAGGPAPAGASSGSASQPSATPAAPPAASTSSAPTSSSTAVKPSGTALSGTFAVTAPSTASYTAHETFLQQNSPFTPVGTTSAVSGTLTLAAGRFLPSTVTVGLSTLKTDNAMRDRHVQAALDTAAYPDAVFAITGEQSGSAVVDTAGAAEVRLTGHMTIHGTVKPLVWTVEVQAEGAALHLSGSTAFNMSLFGVTPPSIAGFVAVKDGLTLAADLTAKRG